MTNPSIKKVVATVAALFCLSALIAQSGTLTGTVVDEAGVPLIGANLYLPASATGTITDVDGNFSLEVPDLKNDTLEVSYTGYRPQKIAIDGRRNLDITLTESSAVLDEVVVVGYGVQRKSDLTGSISKVEGEELLRIPTSSAAQALQGRVAGVQVTPNSGRPGDGATIRIRGVGTFGDNDPLFVVDGMILDENANIDFINPGDIESIEVLKDASATAIYGTRGANGVVIVTTKKGKTNQDAVISFGAYYGIQDVIDQIEVTNGAEYAQLTNEAAVNEGGSAPYPDPEMFGEGTDWQDLIFQTAPIQNYQVSARGGSEKMTYSASFAYFQQDGVVRGTDFERFSIRLNNEYKIKPSFSLGHNISLIYEDRTNGPTAVNTALRSAPIATPFDSLGNFSSSTADISSTGNIEATLFYNNNTSFSYRGVGNFYADLKFLKDFSFRTNFGLDLRQAQQENFNPVFEVSSIQQNEDADFFISEVRNRNWLWENTLSYNKDFGQHRVSALAGITSQDFSNEGVNASRSDGFLGETEDFFYIFAGSAANASNGGFANSSSLLSYLFRVNYTAFDRYLLTATFRRDGSSKFGPNFRYGNFPSVALGWNVTNEPWMANQSLFTRLKLRGSWGITGNDQIPNYAYSALVTNNLNVIFGDNENLNNIQNGAGILDLTNPDLRWEETEQFNIGFEAGFLNNRLTTEIDYYNRTTNDILAALPLPDYIGTAANPLVNAASMRNTGFDFTLGWQDNIGDFSYLLSFNGSTVNNEVLDLGGGRTEIFSGGVQGGFLATRTVVGQPIGSFFGYKIDGVFQNEEELENFPTRGTEGGPGDLRFQDNNGRDADGNLTGEPDGMITDADRVTLGSPIPDFIYGFTIGAEYKGFDLAVDFNGQSGNEIYNEKLAQRFGNYNFEDSYLNRWTGEGTSDFEPRVTNAGHNYIPSDRFIQDGSFLRLRNVTLGYTLPTSLSDKLRIRNLRVYVSGTNLVTWTDYTGYTPEIVNGNPFDTGFDQGVFPISRVFTFGLDFSF